MKLVSLIFGVMFCCASLTAQQSVNAYKYIVVPDSFDFIQAKDQYQLNSLTTFLFNREGYQAYRISDELPKDLFEDRCLALYADAEKVESGLFRTKIQIFLKDCYGNLVYESQVGSSKQKEFGRAYTEALRKAFESFETFKYTYQPELRQKDSGRTMTTTAQTEIVSTTSEAPTKTEHSLSQVEYKEDNPTKVGQSDKQTTAPKGEVLLEDIVLFAQTTESGFKLIDDQPKLVMELVRTAQRDTYTVKGTSAIVFKEDGFWYFSEVVNGQPTKTLLNIKFYE